MPKAPSAKGQAAGLILFGLPFTLLGLALVLQGLSVLPLMGTLNTPRWVLVPAGAAFLLPGSLFVAAGIRRILGIPLERSLNARPVAGVIAVTLSGLSLVLLGMALFGQARAFYGGIPGFVRDKRVVMGLSGLLVGALAGVFWLLFLAPSNSQRARPEENDGGA